jgi:N-acetylneuraminate synthase
MSVEARTIKPSHVDTPIYDIIERCALSEDDEFSLMEHVKGKGVIFISTPFSREAANRLHRFNIPAFKIGSGECNNYPLIKHIAQFGKPIILSTGMNSIATVSPAVEIFREAGTPFALLHCTNVYPTPPQLVRLGGITALRASFPDAVVGLSDHTIDNYTSFGAIALGASIIEKHFTDSKSRPGPDISSSINPDSLKDLILGTKTIHAATGGMKSSIPEEAGTMAFAFASVVAIKDIQPGEKFTTDNIWVMRPGNGDFAASRFEELLGKFSKNKILRNHQLSKLDIE